MTMIGQRKGRASAWATLGVMAGALTLGALFNAHSLAASASALSPGPARALAVTFSEGAVTVSSAIGLDRPRAILERYLRTEGHGNGDARPRPIFVPSPNRPATLLVAGDSLVDPFGPQMARVASATGVIAAGWEVQYSSGLTRPQLFDWAAHFEGVLGELPTDIVVFMVGANDSQPIETSEGWASTGTPEWLAEYGMRVEEMMTLLESRVATVYWVGQPIARSADHSARMEALNHVYREAAGRHDRVRYVDSWAVFADSGGEYADFLPGRGGRVILMRQPDGIHLTPEGGDHLARVVLDAMRLDWSIGP